MTPPRKWKKSECPICRGTGSIWSPAAYSYVPCDHKDRRKGERRKKNAQA